MSNQQQVANHMSEEIKPEEIGSINPRISGGTEPTAEGVQEVKEVIAAAPSKPKKQKPKSRGERFQEAAQDVLNAVDQAKSAYIAVVEALEDACSDIESALDDLRSVRSEYEDWQSNLPENLQNSALGEKLQTICDIDLDQPIPELEEPEFDDIESAAQECLDADLPLGFGRD